jgi:hypothetical protein
MCLACDMEEMWFAVMDARARAAAGEATEVDQPDGPASLLLPSQPDEPHPPLPPPEEGGGSAPNPGQRSASSSRFVCEETSAE